MKNNNNNNMTLLTNNLLKKGSSNIHIFGSFHTHRKEIKETTLIRKVAKERYIVDKLQNVARSRHGDIFQIQKYTSSQSIRNRTSLYNL
jgi:hypothetical protein